MRLIYSDGGPTTGPLDADGLAAVYTYPDDTNRRTPWVRANFVSTLDGAANGPDGRTGSINTGADREVFALLRTLADVIVVGAGTARTERYAVPDLDTSGRRAQAGQPARPAMAVVTRSGDIPPLLRDHAHEADGDPADGDPADGSRGEVYLVTCEQAPEEAVRDAREALGEQRVIVCGRQSADLREAVRALAARGMPRILCEGGPHLMRSVVGSGILNELCLTLSPMLLAGEHPRVLAGPPVEADLRLRTLIEADGSLLGSWVAR